MLEFCVWEGKGTNMPDKFKPLMKNSELSASLQSKDYLCSY